MYIFVLKHFTSYTKQQNQARDITQTLTSPFSLYSNINTMKPIGVVKSIFKFKAATPRQSGLCEAARGSITINRDILNNPGQALEDLDKFSHIW